MNKSGIVLHLSFTQRGKLRAVYYEDVEVRDATHFFCVQLIVEKNYVALAPVFI